MFSNEERLRKKTIATVYMYEYYLLILVTQQVGQNFEDLLRVLHTFALAYQDTQKVKLDEKCNRNVG